MTERFDLDEQQVSKEDILEEFGVVVKKDDKGQTTTEAYADIKKRASEKARIPTVMLVMYGLIGLVVVGILVAAIASYAGKSSTTGIKVPAVVGMPAALAKEEISKAGLRPVERSQKSDKPAGTVISTDPSAGTAKKEGADVIIVVATK